MRKKKENIRLRSQVPGELPMTDALETEREERYEEIGGETATEGVGVGYSTEPEFEESVPTADGPISNESNKPPAKEAKVRVSKNIERRRTNADPLPPGRHRAARSSKTI